jgi:hypothetical protein
MPWQENPERGALALNRVDIDEAARLLDDAVDRGEPEASALPTSLVEKNGSKILSTISAGMPVPVSVTSTQT